MSVNLDRTDTAVRPAVAITPVTQPRWHRHFLMCPPTYFRVSYAINPWMRTDVGVDHSRAAQQWERLRRTFLELGHTVDLIDPDPALPDMVFAANGGLVVNGRTFGARFRYAERAAEGPAYLAWLAEHHGSAAPERTHEAVAVNEGEGDFLVAGDRILAGTGFRTDAAAHEEAAEFLGVTVESLELIDPRFYHLDTALFVLDDVRGQTAGTIAYYPPAFSAASQERLRQLYPDALVASADDALVLGLNAVCDGTHVVLAAEATRLAEQVRERGYEPLPVAMSEFRKAGGGPKCCTLEIRSEQLGATHD